jgi:hypothetical protein
VCKNRKATCAGGGDGFQILIPFELAHPPDAPVIAVVVVVVVVVRIAALAGDCAGRAPRIGWSTLNSVVQLPSTVLLFSAAGNPEIQRQPIKFPGLPA